jgi:hypothetical protein
LRRRDDTRADRIAEQVEPVHRLRLARDPVHAAGRELQRERRDGGGEQERASKHQIEHGAAHDRVREGGPEATLGIGRSREGRERDVQAPAHPLRDRNALRAAPPV